MDQPFKTAQEVSEYLLKKTERAAMSDDIDAILPYFHIPIEIQTFEGCRIVRTEDDLRSIFKAVGAHYTAIGVTDIVRYCVEASFSDPHTVVAMHETRLITGNYITRSPFPTLSVLKFNGEEWQVTSSSYAIDDQDDHNAALMSAGVDYPSRSSSA